METNNRNNFSKEEIEQGRLERKTLQVSRRYIASKNRGVFTVQEVQRQLQINSDILSLAESLIIKEKELINICYNFPVLSGQYKSALEESYRAIQKHKKTIAGLSELQKKLKKML